jgi:hypothetical protein
LDCIVVSLGVTRDLKAKITLINPVTMYREDLPADWSTRGDPQNYTLSDHSAVIMQIKSNCQLRIKKFLMSESYKLSPFLSSPRKQRQFTSATNKLGNELSEAMHLGLDEINKRIVEGLRSVSKTEIGISATEDTRVYTDVKEVTTTLGASRKCSAEVHKLEILGDAVAIQRSRAEHTAAKRAYFRAVRMQTQKVHDQRGRKLQQMDAASESKMLHSMINKAKEGGERKGAAATEATMNFEGRTAQAVEEGQIKQLLAAYTAYVSMDNTDEATGEHMDTHLKNTVHSFSRTEGIEAVFDEQAQQEVDARCATIREEYTKEETSSIEPQLEVPYTKKEMKRAMKN